MTAYYILAVSFGALAVIVSAYGIWGPGKKSDFPGALSIPLMLLFLVMAVATLTALTIGANNEEEAHGSGGDAAAVVAPTS